LLPSQAQVTAGAWTGPGPQAQQAQQARWRGEEVRTSELVLFYNDFMGFYNDFMGFYNDVMGFYNDFMGF